MTLPKKTIPYLLIIILTCFASRLPLLLDNRLMLDGDECVVALMAKHAYLGKGLSIFFWGQNYGFSLIEVLFIIPFYAVLGYTTVAVKLAMLTLWSIGVVFLYKTMVAINKDNKLFAFLLILVLVLSPTWSNWSMEARGGYLTSFTLTSVIFYLLFTTAKINHIVRYLLIGLFTYIVYIAQPFWLVGLLPLVVYQIISEKNTTAFISFSIAIVVSYFAVRTMNTDIESVYAVHPNLTIDALISNIIRIPEYLFKSLQGNYSFAWYQDTTIFHTSFAKIIRALLFLLSTIGLLHLLLNRKGFGLFITATIFIPLTFAYSLTTDEMQGRYLLPVIGFTLLAIYIYSNKLRLSIPLHIGALLLIILSGLSTIAFPVYFNGQHNRQELETTLTHLKKHNIKNLYAANCMLPWEIMFYSDEKILCRMFYFPGRYPKYDTAVDRAFYAGEKTALIGYWRDYAGLELDSLDFENHYYISQNPSKELLKEAFEFPLPDTFNNAATP